MQKPFFIISAFTLQTLLTENSSALSLKVFVKNPIESNSLSNVYIDYEPQIIKGEVSLTFGNCKDGNSVYHIVHQINITKEFQPDKFVWHVPENAYKESGCLLVKDASGDIVAKSKPYTIHKEKAFKYNFPTLTNMHLDTTTKYQHSDENNNKQNYALSKNAKIGIIGAGISGLFSAFLLDQAGFHNYEILESSNKLGGRIRTTYFNNSTTAYQDMGAMRIPVEYKFNNTTHPVKSHNIVFQVSEELNSLNNESHQIEFIEWWIKRPNNLYYKNGFRLPDGRIPTIGEVEANPDIPPHDRIEALAKEIDAAEREYFTADWFKLMSKDMYKAHTLAMEKGYDEWSEWCWLHNKMGVSLNATDYRSADTTGMIWSEMYDRFSRISNGWKAIKGGFNRLPAAFGPLLSNRIRYNTRVSKLEFVNDKVSVQWKNTPFEKYNAIEYDNVIVSAPFSIVRSWYLPQELNYNLTAAINRLGYNSGCKVALEFSSRFWEKLERPIEGGCDDIDLLSAMVCYPVNDIGSDGPGVVLASYVQDQEIYPFLAMTEEERIAHVLEDFTQLHGDLVKQYYTGNYDQICWLFDKNSAGGWAEDKPGQQTLFLPSYFKMDHGLVFVGEHTDVKHAWISGAMQSSIRGVVMVLIDHGHIDEAKSIIKKYKADWLKI